MKKSTFQILTLFGILIILFSCSKKAEEENSEIKEGAGTVWLSGGLFFCAEQIRMENGDTLIPTNTVENFRYKSGQKVSLKYSEINPKETGCNIGKDCEIIEIKLLE